MGTYHVQTLKTQQENDTATCLTTVIVVQRSSSKRETKLALKEISLYWTRWPWMMCVCVISTFGFGCYGNNQIKSRTWTERRLSPKKKRWVNSNLNFHVFVSEVLQGKTVQIEGDLACSAFNPKPCSGYLLKHFTSLLCWRNIGGTKTHKQCKVCELLLNCITSSFICHCDCMSVNLWYFMRISFFLPLCSCGSDTAFLSKTVNLLSQKNVLMMEPTDHQLLFH